MLSTTNGIVLSRIRYGDSGVIAKIFTEQFGLRSYLAQGVRSKRSKMKLIHFQPLTSLEIVAYHKENQSLGRLKEIQLIRPNDNITENPKKSAIAQFVSELLLNTLHDEEADDDLHNFLLKSVAVLEQLDHGYASFAPWFTWHLTKHLGILPQGNCNSNTPYFQIESGEFGTVPGQKFEVSESLSTGIDHCLNATTPFEYNVQDGRLLDIGLLYFQFHIQSFKELKSLPIVQEIFN